MREEGLERNESFREPRRKNKRLRCMFLFAIATGGLVSAGISFRLFSQQQQEGDAKFIWRTKNEIETILDLKLTTLVETAHLLATSVSATSASRSEEATWSFLFDGSLDTTLEQSVHLADALQMSVAPVVENLETWTEFVDEQSVPNPDILQDDGNGDLVPTDKEGPYAPVSLQFPIVSKLNFDVLSNPGFTSSLDSLFFNDTKSNFVGEADIDSLVDWIYPDCGNSAVGSCSVHVQPVHGSNGEGQVVGLLLTVFSWGEWLSTVDEVIEKNHYLVYIRSDCTNYVAEYKITSDEITFVKGQMTNETTDFKMMNSSGRVATCNFALHVEGFVEHASVNQTGLLLLFVTFLVFGSIGAVFVFMENRVSQSLDTLAASAKRTNAIVSSFFPAIVRDRILNEPSEVAEPEVSVHSDDSDDPVGEGNSTHLEPEESKHVGVPETPAIAGRPIADFFPSVTILFADLVGFTAWSSVREPAQVFTLLETLYGALDNVAARRNVFKVETVGDCYVAVTGCPNPNPNHAVDMAQFACDSITVMANVTRRLEPALGPGTGDLAIRVGMHSGSVTGGVLRGDKGRFQLFGDSMNTTARVETNGAASRVHVSADTATLLRDAGKAHWITERPDKVKAKGKGMLTTYWLIPHLVCSTKGALEATSTTRDTKKQRLLDWNVDILLKLLRELVARREALDIDNPKRRGADNEDQLVELETRGRCENGASTLSEVKEIVVLPNFNAIANRHQRDAKTVVLSDDVVAQVRDFVFAIAGTYRSNKFHNFEHASHVTMSAVKLIARILAPKPDAEGDEEIHDHTYGVTMDPMSRFACIFAALIHDVDHRGVPNSTLVEQGSVIATVYNNKSVAEQNSVDIAWNLLMDDRFRDFRRTIYSTASGFGRFRALVVNSVMATDVMDKELNQKRAKRWERAFAQRAVGEPEWVSTNRKATIVIEHLLQASDVCHTMQHWHIYRKWNQRLFEEIYDAYRAGHSKVDPSEGWYEGEMKFFDFYVIPLAKKLQTCGVFGVSGDEYLNYAVSNRAEWEEKGKDTLAGYMAKIKREDEAAAAEAAAVEEKTNES